MSPGPADVQFQAWFYAFLLTQAVEIPIYATAARHLTFWRRLGCAAGASVLSHPILWFLLPWDRWPYWITLILGEAYVILVEVYWLRACRVPKPVHWSITANAASCVAGLIYHRLSGV